MRKTYHMNASEINQTFVEELKATFKDKQVEIVISEAPNEVCLYDFEVIESDEAPIDPNDTHVDDGSIESFLLSGKKTLRGPNGEKPVGKIIRIETSEVPDERWQALFDSADQALSVEMPRIRPMLATKSRGAEAKKTAAEKVKKDT